MTESVPSVVFLTFDAGFPNGMAAAYRIQLLARGLAEAGSATGVICTRATERRSSPKNTQRRGTYRGIWFAYPCGDPVLGRSFLGRRWSEVRGLVGTVALLLARRARGEADCVVVYGYASTWMFMNWVLVNALRSLRFPVMTDLVELPWSLKSHPSVPERVTSPLRPFRGLTVISGSLGEWVVDERRRLRREIRAVHLPALVDCGEFAADEKRPREPQALFAVAPEYHDAMRFVRQVMARVWLTHPTCRLVVTGFDPVDPRAASIVDFCKSSGDPRIVLAGYLRRDQLIAEYARSSVCLAPLFLDERSQARFPTKVVEYLAAGRPVVTTRVGELASVLTHRQDAMLAEADDVDGFAACIADVLEDEQLWEALASGGRRLAERKFDYRVHAPALLALVSSVVDR